MKKRILGAAIIAATALAAGWNFNQSKNEVVLSDLALANVDALARYEIEVGVPCIMTSQTCYVINDDLGHTVIPGYK